MTTDEFLKDLVEQHNDFGIQRKAAVNRWSIFGHGYQPKKEGEAHTLYLDVIGLGEKCWGKKETDDVSYVCQNSKCNNTTREDSYNERCEECGEVSACVPTRTRKKTIEGFGKSRMITAMIESTFGRIITEQNPREILSMGGDEIIAKIDPGSWGDIVEEVEKHCNILHGSFLAELPPEPLWWAMDLPPGLKPDVITSEFKESLRTINMDWGMRFVEPMFSNLTSIGDV